MNEKLLDILMSENNQKDGDEIENCNILEMGGMTSEMSEIQPIQKVISQ